jgi:hypothetical protein
MEHARNDYDLLTDLSLTNDNYDYAEERNVISGPERQMAIDLGESIRYDHRAQRVYRVFAPYCLEEVVHCKK